MTPSLDWQLVKEAALALGAQPNTVEQWKSRNWVPPRWWLPLSRANGEISPETLESLEPRREAAE